MTIVKCKTADELLEALAMAHSIFRGDGVYFRGQGRAYQHLVPSLFRLDKSLEALRNLEAASVAQTRQYLISEQGQSGLVVYSELTAPGKELIDNQMLSVVQHYGCPTRLLDFTRDYRVAAAFAASDSLRTATTDESNLVVYAFSKSVHVAQHINGSFVDNIGGAGVNANVGAQSGVFLKPGWECSDCWPAAAEEPVVTHPELPTVDLGVYSINHFIRYDLPAQLAPELWSRLRDRGCDGLRVFPGLPGLVMNLRTDFRF